MKLTFLGAAQTVTGSSYLLETDNRKILIDCGLFQGNKELRERNQMPFPYNPAEIDYLLLTHAHIDHSGLIPRLCKNGFRGKIITTSATKALCGIMLPDSGHIQEMEVEWQNRKRIRAGKPLIEPLYTVEDAKACLKFFRGAEYGEWVELSDQLKVRFRDAGHILGSAFIELVSKEGSGKAAKIVFSGDLGCNNRSIIRDPEVLEDADYLLIESTYGDRVHRGRQETLEQFLQIIKASLKDGGNIVIPAFAIERTQEILYDLNQLIEKKMIPELPVYIDSPLAISATDIFRKHSNYFNVATKALLDKGDSPFDFPSLTFAREVEESKALNEIEGGAIIISASGMCEAGRIKHHLKHNLWRPEAHVIFVGYQAIGTLGRSLVDGAKEVKIFGEEIAVRAHIDTIGGFSAHADQEELLSWLGKIKEKPKTIFVVHGEEKSSHALARKIKNDLKVDTIIPGWGQAVELV